MVCGKPLYFFKITALPLSFRCMYLQCKELCPALYCPLCSTQCFQTNYLASFQHVIPQQFWIQSELSTLQSRTGPVQGQNGVFSVYFSHTGKNLFSLQGSQVMDTGFSESHYSHMCSSTLHDPIFPHVQFHWEYALGCIATCTVPATMHDPIFPHVQFQLEYELASHGSCTVDSYPKPNLT